MLPDDELDDDETTTAALEPTALPTFRGRHKGTGRILTVDARMVDGPDAEFERVEGDEPPPPEPKKRRLRAAPEAPPAGDIEVEA